MLTREEILKRLREHKTELQQKFPLKGLALLGSYARNEQTDESGINVMVEFSEAVGFESIDLTDELEKFFNYKIDLVSKKGVKARYHLPYIEYDAIYA
jgi:uncharacterized protein